MTVETTVDTGEIARFDQFAARWWDPNGPMAPLHRLNPTRLAFLKTVICTQFGRDSDDTRPFAGLSLLDLGCGGGLISEPMARLGAAVTGADAAAEAIAVARAHADEAGLAITYRADPVERLSAEPARFDVVLALEIVEHVADRRAFLRHCRALLAPGGLLVVSTLNRSARGYLLGILAAEYILGWVPRGTHRWRLFVRPSELAGDLRAAGLCPATLSGLSFDPASASFRLSRDVGVNYFMTATA